ncbi:hypothetical protein C900_00408 [Fulvivirga imtechensis AK7]|uniref:Uncharacterized protein n=1 Tax=Fulvivirga imtechensis AK7 TaxID=1237149 RepID=L8JHP3_9BACT|nr:hypothetical protein [Fulvivirga imtechensis]ELR68376.1 hypothetical protein C900_00408 [Fulvivirga imtechensis AK7]
MRFEDAEVLNDINRVIQVIDEKILEIENLPLASSKGGKC